MTIVLNLIRVVGQILSLLVIAHVIVGYVLPWDNPVRRTLDKFISPLLRPIQSAIKPIGDFDFSPLVIILLINALEWLLSALARAIFR